MTVDSRCITEFHTVHGALTSSRAQELLARWINTVEARSVLLVGDELTLRLFGSGLTKAFETLEVPWFTVTVPRGESCKSVTSLTQAWETLGGYGMTRRSLLVGLGGGAVCDLTGFIAATYLRGLPYVLFPTTLVAQADAAIGGKVGINGFGAKNAIGGFHHPVGVVMDPDCLMVLGPNQLADGYAEIVKVAMVDDPQLLRLLVEHRSPELRVPTAQILQLASETKIRLLAPDPLEWGTLDRPLNFGHCFAHPIEVSSGFSCSHGEAVAMGMTLALAVGVVLQKTPVRLLVHLMKLLADYRLPVALPIEMEAAVFASLDAVRLVRNGRLRLVLLSELHEVCFVDDLEYHTFEAANALIRSAIEIGTP